MGRDFEFKQLLRAYRNGIIDEATFEKEMAGLEGGSNGASTNGGGFRAMGKSYPSERAAIMSFLENGAAGEAGGAEAFTKWAEVCKTDCIRSGLRMVAEREAYHSRQLAQRLHELGGECRATHERRHPKVRLLCVQSRSHRRGQTAASEARTSATPVASSSRRASLSLRSRKIWRPGRCCACSSRTSAPP